MTSEGKNSWLVPLADLSLILFIVTGATLAGMLGTADPEEQQVRQEPQEDEANSMDAIAQAGIAQAGIAQGVASSVFADVAGGPALGEWLLQYSPGPGEQLTIQVFHKPSERAAATRRAEELAQQAITAGQQPRIIFQPANETHIMAIIAHDLDPQMAQPQMAPTQMTPTQMPPAQMARPLLQEG